MGAIGVARGCPLMTQSGHSMHAGAGVVISGQMHCRPRPIAPAPRDRPHRRHSDQAFDASHKSFCRQCNGLKRVENLLSLDFVIVLRDEVGVVKLLQLAQA